MAENFPIIYFKGINTKVSDLLMAEDELKEAVNIDLTNPGIIQKRPGYVQRGNTLSTQIRGLFPFYQSNGTAQLLVAYANPNDTTTLFLRARTTQNFLIDAYQWLTRGNGELSAINFIDRLFVVGYDAVAGSFIAPIAWNGTVNDSPSTNGMPYGKYIDVVNGYLCIANGIYSEAGNSRVWWATPPGETLPYSITWDNANNWWDFEPHNGEEITGIKSAFNHLLVFKNTSVHSFDPVGQTSQVISNVIGCDSFRSIQNIGKLIIFYNRKGVYATNGQDIQLISEPVDKFIDAINQDNVGNVCAGNKDDRYYHFFIGTLTIDGTTYTNCELVYDVARNSWTTNELSHAVTIYCTYIQPTQTTTTSTSSSSSSSSSNSTSSQTTSSSSASSSSISTSITI